MNRVFQALLFALTLTAVTTASSAGKDPSDEPRPHVVVVGNVRKEGKVPYMPEMTLMSAIAAAGGTSDFGAAPVYLIRNAKSTPISMRAIRKDPSKDIPLKPWDIIYVN